MKRTTRMILLALLLSLLLSTTAFADMGPKPSVNIYIEGLEDRPCVATLLSEEKSTGPAGAWDGEYPPRPQKPTKEDRWRYDAFLAFADYRDPDGYYFLCETFLVTQGRFSWGYYPPSPFKVLLYFPDTGELLCGPKLERFAFRSDYQVTLNPDGSLGEFQRLTHLGEKLQAFAIRAGLTVLVELLLALAWGYRNKKAVLLVLAVNLATQMGLNLLLAFGAREGGYWGFFYVLQFLGLELAIFIAEALIYGWRLPKLAPNRPKKSQAVAYALVANAASLALGLWLAKVIPLAF